MYEITWRQEIELEVSPPVAKSHFDHSAPLGMEHHLIRDAAGTSQRTVGALSCFAYGLS